MPVCYAKIEYIMVMLSPVEQQFQRPLTDDMACATWYLLFFLFTAAPYTLGTRCLQPARVGVSIPCSMKV